ncbi:hypothetical protein Syun_011258 [Stephania yunnanensis]|uniref:Omega-hydroxypalmitate O-feruloyl transferase n=1 Tax=Stephania yunnanensis TaxID=152371 RepID=A0AAP0JYF8_9MAGN
MASLVQELQVPHINIQVTIDHVTPVMPAAPIPVSSGDSLYLSNLDDMIGARVFTPTVYFYRCNCSSSKEKRVGEILRDALVNVLVPYYPFSGRLREIKNGKLEVFFGPNQGALMVEAHTDIAITDLGELEVPNPCWSPLIYIFPNEYNYKMIDMPLVIAQVTTFRCGGFSLGLRICHCLCDGQGAMQFISAWAATAKTGTLSTSPNPCWDREFFLPRNPPMVKFRHAEFMKIDETSSLTSSLWQAKPLQKCYRISEEFQTRLKERAQPQNHDQPCTSFDAMAAHLWRSWVKALDVKPMDYELRLTFSVNARQKLKDPVLQHGFYGNVVCLACATSTVSEVIEGKISSTAARVRKARQSVTEEYVRSTIDFMEVDRPTRLEFAGKLTITQWTRLSIYECADFGWGNPVYAGPIDLTPTPQVCVILPEGEGAASPRRSILVCICLSESAALRFKECLLEICD